MSAVEFSASAVEFARRVLRSAVEWSLSAVASSAADGAFMAIISPRGSRENTRT